MTVEVAMDVVGGRLTQDERGGSGYPVTSASLPRSRSGVGAPGGDTLFQPFGSATHEVVVCRRCPARSRPVSVRRFSLLSRREALTTAAIRSPKRGTGTGRRMEARFAAMGVCALLRPIAGEAKPTLAGQAA